MERRTSILLPKCKKVLNDFGENIKLARLRRKMSMEQLAERANISRSTLWLIEKGTSTVAIGAYIQVLFVLGLEKDILRVGSDDILGRKLQDAQLQIRERAPKKPKKE